MLKGFALVGLVSLSQFSFAEWTPYFKVKDLWVFTNPGDKNRIELEINAEDNISSCNTNVAIIDTEYLGIEQHRLFTQLVVDAAKEDRSLRLIVEGCEGGGKAIVYGVDINAKEW